MQEDDGIQEIYTRDHGVVKVLKNSWQDGGHHIVLTPSGSYQHMSGLPIKDEDEIEAAFGTNEGDKQKCLNWFRNRHDQAGKGPRVIGMHPDGYPVFDDGTVPDFEDLYAYFRPGKGLTGMIVALQDYKDRTGSAGPPKELRQAAPSAETVTEPSPKAVPVPTLDPLKYSSRARKSVKDIARAKANRAKAKAAKEAQTAAQAPPQG
jgi:hypothetical protein